MNDENYQTIIIIMMFMAVLPLTLMYAVGPFTVVHIYPRVFGLITRNKVNVNPIDYPNSYIARQVTKKKNHYQKLVHLTSLLFTSVGIYICFLVVHAYSIIRFIQYGDKVLSSYQGKSHPLPIAHAAISSMVVGGGFILSVTILVIRISKSKKHDAEVNLGNLSSAEEATGSTRQTTKTHWQVMLTAGLISVNIAYIGCYFMPYMLLSFIHDPLLTILTYVMVALFIACVYLVFQGAWHLCKFCKKCEDHDQENENTTDEDAISNDTKDEDAIGNDTTDEDAIGNNTTDEDRRDNDNATLPKLFDTLLYSYMVWAVASSVIIFLFVIIYIITLGSFDDFHEFQSITPSILIALLGLFLLKPAYKFTKKKFKDDNCNLNNNNNQPTTTNRQQPTNNNQPITINQQQPTSNNQEEESQL